MPFSCGIPVWKHWSLLRLSFSVWFMILSSFAGPQSWTWHWEAGAAVDLPPAAGGPGGPALGWAALRRKKTEGREEQRGKQTLSRALTPGCYRGVVRAISISSSLLVIVSIRNHLGFLCESHRWGNSSSRPSNLTLYKCPTALPPFPHLNNEMVGVAQWFSLRAMEISSSRQNGVIGIGFIVPPEMTKTHKIMKQWFTRHWISGNEGGTRNK